MSLTLIIKLLITQEDGESTTFGWHVSNWLKLYIRNPGVKSYRLVYNESNRRGGSGRVQSFSDPPSNTLLGHSYQFLNISSESSAQTQPIGTLIEQIGFGGGGCGHVQKSEAHALGPRGESSQWSSNLPHSYRIVPAWDSRVLKDWKYCGTVQASQLWVPGKEQVHGRPYLSFCPITLQHFSFRS